MNERVSDQALDASESIAKEGVTVLGLSVIKGGIYTALAQTGKAVLSIASAIVLARLLQPADFGLVAMVTSVASLLRIFRDAGLSSATIQSKSISRSQVSNLFWVNLCVGALLAALLAAAGPLIARFYREPRLVAVCYAMAAGFVLSGTVVQHRALLARALRFGRIAAIEVLAALASLAVGVVLAMTGWGYWSLVGSSLALETATLLLVWAASGWRPLLPSRGVGTLALLGFGASMTAGSVLHIVSRNFDSVLLGRMHGADVVGLYSRASVLLMRPIEQFLMPIGSVIVPVLARLNDEPDRYRRIFLRFYSCVALFGFPVAGLCLALARPITLVLLGPRWEEVASVFAAFSLAALYLPLAAPTGWLLVSQGRGREFVILNAILAGLSITSFLVGVPFGAVGVASAYSFCSLVLSLPVLFHICGARGPVSRRDLWTVFVTHSPLWLVAFGGAYLASGLAADGASGSQLAAGASVGALCVACVMALVPTYRVSALGLIEDGLATARSYR